jgi:transposase
MARRHGSAALVATRGRPPKLSDRQVTRARVWAGQGWTQQAISQRLGVTRSVISVLLARWGPVPA